MTPQEIAEQTRDMAQARREAVKEAASLLDACLDGKLTLVVIGPDGRRGRLERPVAVYSRDPRDALVDQVDMLMRGALVTPGTGRVLAQFGKGEWTIQIQLGEELPGGDRIGMIPQQGSAGLVEVKS